MTIENRKDSFVFNDLINDEAQVVANDGNFSLFSFEGNNHDFFMEQQLAERVAHMAVSIEDFEKNRDLKRDLVQFISNRNNVNN